MPKIDLFSSRLNKQTDAFVTWFPEPGSFHSNAFTMSWHNYKPYMDRVKRIWYLSPMRAAKVQASMRIRAVSPEPPLLAHTSSVSRGTFRQKARSLAPLNGWVCTIKVCHDGMLEDTNSLDGAHIFPPFSLVGKVVNKIRWKRLFWFSLSGNNNLVPAVDRYHMLFSG